MRKDFQAVQAVEARRADPFVTCSVSIALMLDKIHLKLTSGILNPKITIHTLVILSKQ